MRIVSLIPSATEILFAIGAGDDVVGVPVWAFDADGHFARPGPRLVDGVEVLAGILHPETSDPSSTAAESARIVS